MPKYAVEVTWRTVTVQHASVEVEVDGDKFAAGDMIYDLIVDGDIEPDWGREDIIDADYIVGSVTEVL